MGVKKDRLVVVLDGPLRLSEIVVRNAPADVGQSKLRVKTDRLVVVLDGPLRLP